MTPDPMKSCAFTGHRKIEREKLPVLVEKLHFEIDWLAGHGIENFYAGGALGFDTISALAVLWHRQKNPSIRLHLMLPCPEQYRNWKQNDIDVFKDIAERADSVTVLCDHYHGGVMHMRNRAMVDAADFCICYWDKAQQIPGKSGGTLYTVNYARKLGRKVINLWDEPPEDPQIEFTFGV